MCESHAYIVKEGKEELFLENVDVIRPEESGKLLIRSIFGEQKLFEGHIREISLLKHRIVLEK
ncbi:MAG: CooT family nickel-binding protein [Deltaproteobacteria bacterium]